MFKLKNKLLLIIIFATVLYIPLIFFGYGTDGDSFYSVIQASKIILREHRYVPSRPPGYIVHETPTAILFMLGGSVLTNLGTVAMSIVTIYSFIRICEYYDIPHKHTLAIFLIVNPIYWVNSTSTIDYIWALGLFLFGYHVFLREKYLLAGLFFGLSIGARLTSSIFVTVLIGYYLFTTPQCRNKIFSCAIISVVLGLLLYFPAFKWAGYTINFLTYSKNNDWGIIDHLPRFIYKNIYFWGIQTIIAFWFFIPLIACSTRTNYIYCYKNIIMVSVLIIVGCEALFIKAPFEYGHLLPILPFTLILIGIFFKNKRWVIILLLTIQFSYNFININIAKPDIQNHATKAKISLWIEWGYLVADVIKRHHGLVDCRYFK